MADPTDAITNIDVGALASGFMDSVSQLGGYLVWIIVIGALMATFIYILSFKHQVSVRVLNANGNTPPVKDRAREIKVDGVVYWKLLKRKDIIPVPPAEAIDIIKPGAKPRLFAEFSYSVENGYVPLHYDVDTKNFAEKLTMTKHGRIVDEPFQPFTSNQRSLYVMQLRKAEARKKKDLLERITQLATPLVLAVLVVSILIFWEDVAKPGKEMAQINVAMQESNRKMMETLNDISAQNARIVQAQTGAVLDIEQKVTG